MGAKVIVGASKNKYADKRKAVQNVDALYQYDDLGCFVLNEDQ